MDRKTVIFFIVLLAVLAVGTGVAVAFLYSGTGDSREQKVSEVLDEQRYLLFPAIPSDAVMVACLSEASDALPGMYDDLGLTEESDGLRTAVSLHYSGELTALYVFDLGQAASVPSDRAAVLMEAARGGGFVAEYVDCSTCQGLAGDLASHAVVLVSRSETLVKASVRHLSKSVSVLDSPGFAAACRSCGGENLLFVSNVRAGNFLPAVFTRKYASYSGFVSRLCEWTVLGLDNKDNAVTLNGTPVYDKGADEFMTVLASSVPSVSSVAEVLPSYTVGAFALPMADLDSYVGAYEKYLDSRQTLHLNRGRQKDMAVKTGISPLDMVRSIAVKEVAKAFFRCGGEVENVLLVKTGTDGFRTLLNYEGTEKAPAVNAWPYAGALATVFGDLFSLEDESHFTYVNGWLVVGSAEAVGEYADGRALEYSLEEYMTDAAAPGLLSRAKASFAAYFSFSADVPFLSEVFRKEFLADFDEIVSGAEYSPAVLLVTPGKKGVSLNAEIRRLTLQKTKAPVFERDTVVYVPEGPFEIKNSGTGKMNRFYQNRHLSLCLSEDGKDLWGVPFKTPICGTARNVDYFANGKLQIAFGAGSRIYIIDRLGRFVKGFPIDLGKDILIGPDVYDFNGTRKYNIMVLHKDNTVDMYNLKGQKPASWKGICPSETVKALPEALKVGGNTFWVVRTSMQTLIYPFYGGQPLTTFTGNQMIRPDSEVKVVDGTSVEVSCYDGKHRTVRLK